MKNDIHLANKNRWDASAKRWAECADSRGIWQVCHKDPSLVFSERVLAQLAGIRDKKVVVLGSGDNEAVFALAGMGAQVTSVDISDKQLQVAAERAKILGLGIEFVQADVTDLTILEDQYCDLVYTGGHVAVWVSDLNRYYAEAVRILKPGGVFIVDEYHPFRRVWAESETALVIANDYFKRGPYKYLLGDDVLYKSAGVYASFEFHWTISDFMNAILKAGATILEVDEYGTYVGDWEGAPMQGLPEHLLIIAEKR
ncbi:MAG: class I SAM-dependent methyltransferase [Saprospiraceae bacterium]